MKTCIMQPYLFPYLGYWQMIANVDTFVLFDDVNFIKRGWINRNNILIGGQAHLFTLPLIDASQNKLINEIEITPDEKEKQKLLKTFEMAYKKAPQFSKVFAIIEKIISNSETNLALYLYYQFEQIFNYLNIKTELKLSSRIDHNRTLKAQDKIIDICHALGTTHYINAIGGQELYDKERFNQENMRLNFIKMKPIQYQQFQNEFTANLSIIDALMFNDTETIKTMLTEFELV